MSEEKKNESPYFLIAALAFAVVVISFSTMISVWNLSKRIDALEQAAKMEGKR